MKLKTLLCVLFIIAVQTAQLFAAVLPVGGRTYPTIQSAISAANNGDTVEIPQGVWSGSGNVNLDVESKKIIIRSTLNDPDVPEWDIINNTIIDCQGSRDNRNRAFTIDNGQDETFQIIGITIKNGFSSGNKGNNGAFGSIGGPANLDRIGEPYYTPPTDPLLGGPPRAFSGTEASGDGFGGAIE